MALNPRKKIPFKLVERVTLSRNSRLFRFALQSPQHRLGLPVGQHMFFSAKARAVFFTILDGVSLCMCSLCL